MEYAAREQAPVHGSRALLIGVLAAMSGVGVAMVAVRNVYAGNGNYWFLVWNLFLAWLPLLFAFLAEAAWRARLAWLAASCGVLWLLFLPNAPYILTDLLHLTPAPPVPLWYDVLLLVTFAWTGLLLGFVSLLLIHRGVERSFSRRLGWFVALVSLVLSGFGIYLGRFVRWNSWDVFTQPGALAGALASGMSQPQAHPRLVVVTALLSGLLILLYVAMWNMANLSAQHPTR